MYFTHSTSPHLWRALKPEARRMRHTPTEAEELLWQSIRSRRLGTRFRRQHAIDRFIVDFVCFPERLIVEVDGESHSGRVDMDAKRDEVLRASGFQVVRYTNEQITNNLSIVLNDIQTRLGRSREATAQASPSPHGEGAGG